ncbi:MAG: outer membrane protein assembly factor BamE [Arenicella sp.]|nr:outer membrane protein assembly factor BamE [Arenicella sp.]
MNKKASIVLIACSLALSACIKPYQPNVQQGNIINNSNLREIRYGMNKQEVLFILGTPMVIDPFNEQRWDYFYSNRNRRKGETAQRLITAIFDGDKLIELNGDVDLSNVQNLEPSTEDKQHGGTVITKPTQKEKGLFNRLGLFQKKDKIGKKKKK